MLRITEIKRNNKALVHDSSCFIEITDDETEIFTRIPIKAGQEVRIIDDGYLLVFPKEKQNARNKENNGGV